MAFTATVKAGVTQVGGGMITWTVTDGSLDKTNGTSVIFTSPTVTGNESVTLTASFGGQGVYQHSSSTAHVTVTAATPAQPKATTLVVAPKEFELHGGDALNLSASLNPSDAPSQLITWSLNPASVGSLSSTSGALVTYTAPAVQQNTTVRITASFPGNAQYLASNDSMQGSILAPEVVLRKPTVVVISPSNFSLQSNGTQVLSASVQDSQGNVLTGRAFTWSLSPAGVGSLSSTSGASVTYTAPAVQQNTTVTIIAAFAGDDTYLGSSGSTAGIVTPPSILSYTYVMKFDSATMTNVQLNGPIIMNGTSVALLKAESADMFGWNLSHFGLTASEMDVDDLAVYVTYVSGYCPELGGALGITGGQNINLGPVASATFTNTTFYVVRMEGDSANLTAMAAVSENVGGSEPYVPSIITAPSAAMTHLYSITGPTTWGALTSMVSNITTGRIDLSQFAIRHPIAYSLDRQGNTYSATEEWSLTASSATGLNVSAFVVYFQVTGGEMVVVTATGEDNIFNMIPFGLNTGGSFTALDATVEPVYFAAQQLALGSFVLSIGG